MLAVVYMMIIIKEKIMWKKSKVGIDYVWENEQIEVKKLMSLLIIINIIF